MKLFYFFFANCLFSLFPSVSLGYISSSTFRWMLYFIDQSDFSLYVFPCQTNLLMPSESVLL